MDIAALGTIRLLEAVRDYAARTSSTLRFYQAGSSEMLGGRHPHKASERSFDREALTRSGRLRLIGLW